MERTVRQVLLNVARILNVSCSTARLHSPRPTFSSGGSGGSICVGALQVSRSWVWFLGHPTTTPRHPDTIPLLPTSVWEGKWTRQVTCNWVEKWGLECQGRQSRRVKMLEQSIILALLLLPREVSLNGAKGETFKAHLQQGKTYQLSFSVS